MQLIPHPDSPAGPVRSFSATARYAADGALELAWRLAAPVGALQVPSPAPAARVDGLWHHTCFEAFIADPHSRGYVELNFAPSGAWQAYGFRGYRDGSMVLPLRHDPVAHWRVTGDTLELDARFRMDSLPGPPGPRPPVTVQVAMTAVVEAADGSLGLWSLRHPPGKADFHHADGFVLRVEP